MYVTKIDKMNNFKEQTSVGTNNKIYFKTTGNV